MAKKRIRIVCLDGYTSNPGDLSWEPFEKQGKLLVYDRTEPEELLERAGDAPILLTNKVELSARIISQLPRLQYIGILATGYNVVDIEAAGAAGIVVSNVPSYSTDSVAQHTIAMLLDLMRGIGLHHQAVQDGQWTQSSDFCFSLMPISECTGKTLAVIGLGQIGQAVARIAVALGMRIIADKAREKTPQQLDGLPVTYLPLEQLFEQADVVSLHCPLTPETQHLVNADRLSRMKSTALLVNTSRGGLVDSEALATALRDQWIAGAALDVLDQEPPPADHPLIGVPRCIITPHIAWYAREARQRLLEIASGNLAAFLDGKPTNVVSKPAT